MSPHAHPASAVLLLVCSFALIASLYSPTASQEAQQSTLEVKLIEHEQQRWAAIKSGESKAFADFLASDFLFVSGMGVFGKSETAKMMASLSFPEHALTDFKVLVVNCETAIVTYQATGMASFGGREPYAFNERHGSGWALREGKWLCVYHHFSPVTKR